MTLIEQVDRVASLVAPSRPVMPRRPPSRPAVRLPYLPGLDGLRALAVLAVVAYHLGWSAAPGGFLGVDVFFVLSGFLITSLLVEEHGRTGRLDLRRFFARRARRLLPALWALLLVVCTTAALFVRGELTELRRDVPAALLYVSNWASLTDQQSYFEWSGRPPLLAHLWSLAIEGQFYAAWPVALLLLLRFRGRRRVVAAALWGAAASTAAMAAFAVRGGYPIPNDPSAAYLGSATHAMGLLLGAALGASWAPWRAVGVARAPLRVELLGLVGLAGVVASFWHVDALSPALYRGGFTAVSALTLAAVASLAHPGSRVGHILGLQPLRYLGQRSYGIYLWHWPVFMLTRPGIELPFDGAVAAAVRVAATLALAEASYRWVERPVRRGELRRWVRQAPGAVRSASGRRRTQLVAGPAALGVLVVAIAAALVVPPVAARPVGAPPSVQSRTLPSAAPPAGLSPGGSPGVAPRAAPGAAPEPFRTAGSALGGPRVPRSAGAAGAAAPATAAAPEPVSAPAPAPATVPAPAPPPTTVVGDSVMAAIAPALASRFPSVEIDAVQSRQPGEVLAALAAIASAGRLGQVVVIGAGTNGAIAEAQLRAMLDLSRPARRVIVLNDFVERPWEAHNNQLIAAVVAEYANAIVLDWNSLAAAHPEWLWTDRIHPRPAGAEAVAAMFLDEAVRAP